MLKQLYFTLIFLLLSQGLSFAQSGTNNDSKILSAAKNNYRSFKYAPAIQGFLIELKAHPDNLEAQGMLANSYRKTENYKQSVYWYAKITQHTGVKPEWMLSYAQVLANTRQYDLSSVWYKKYQDANNQNVMAASFVKAYSNMSAFYSNSKEWKVSYLNINTAASEYAPMYYNNGLLFSSNRSGKKILKRVFEWDDSPFSDLYYSKNLSAIHAVNPDSVLAVLKNQIKLSGKKLYRENDDDTYLTSNDNKVLGIYNIKFSTDTLGNYLAKQIDLKSFPGNVNSRYHEGPAIILPGGAIMFTRNNFSAGRYSKSIEGVNKLKMYTSNEPDYSQIIPFLYNNDQYSVGHPTVGNFGTLLIFTSDMPGGFGGSDLYYCKRANMKQRWGKPVNMGAMINTEGNEMFPTLYQDSILYFSSNGHPGLGGLDVFKVSLSGVKPSGAVVNIGAPVNSSVDDFGFIVSKDGKSGFFASNRRGNDDIYGFNYNPYIRTAPKDGYNKAVGVINTMGVVKPALITIGTSICDSLKDAFAVSKIYYDLDKSFIRPDTYDAFTKLIKVLNAHPDIRVNLASYCDSRGSIDYNIALSRRRSLAAKSYLQAHGVAANRMIVDYYGKRNLVNACPDSKLCSEADQQLNRRTEFLLIKNEHQLQLMNCDWLKQNLHD